MSGDSAPIHIAYSFGTRPEVIRSARLLHLLAADPQVRLTLINSGQHYDANMMEDFMKELEVPPISASLGVGSDDTVRQTGRVMMKTGEVLRSERPQALCVFGDTNSTLGSSLAAAKLGIPLVHIEAGCRSYDMRMPEEVNRRLVDHASDLLFAVSELGSRNLTKESVFGRIEVCGDPQFDVFIRQELERAKRPQETRGILTLHRPENVDDADRLAAVLEEISQASKERGVQWVFPAHPRTRTNCPPEPPECINIVDPVSYREALRLLAESDVCVTDSGGLQKEALWMKVPCVTVRATTEWMETVWQGANVLASPDAGLAEAITRSLEPEKTPDFSNPFGDGNASERILQTTKDWLRAEAAPRSVGR